MATELLMVATPKLLTQNIIYAMPARATMVTVTGAGTVQVSNDGTNFITMTPDTNGNFQTSAMFIRSAGTLSVVTAKVIG